MIAVYGGSKITAVNLNAEQMETIRGAVKGFANACNIRNPKYDHLYKLLMEHEIVLYRKIETSSASSTINEEGNVRGES